MRYLSLLSFVFLSLCSGVVFAEESPAPICKTFLMQACDNSTPTQPVDFGGWDRACASAPNFGVVVQTNNLSCPKKRGCTADICECPSGFRYNVVVSNGISSGSCVPDVPDPTGPGDECLPPQVEYAGLCRDAEDQPQDCGDTYTTAVFVNGRYVCTNDESCGDGSTPTFYSNAQGTWKVCGGDGNSSEPSGGSSAPAGSSSPNTASSTPSTGGGDDGGSGTGSGGGSGSGDGSGNGSGSAASSSSPSGGSGSASSGIGNGGEADASKCENGEPHCDGDPIQCAILIQLWINNCAGYDDVETNNPDDDNEAIQSNFDALISSAEPSVNAEGVLNAMTPGGGNGNGSGSGSGPGTGSGGGNGDGLDLSGLDDAANSGGGGSCPPDRSIRLGLGTFNVSYEFLCDFASQISGLVILIFSYIGAMIVYRSLNW
jgi:hypothetical protein